MPAILQSRWVPTKKSYALRAGHPARQDVLAYPGDITRQIAEIIRYILRSKCSYSYFFISAKIYMADCQHYISVSS